MRINRLHQSQLENPQENEDLSKLTPILEKYKGKKGNLIPILQQTQQLYGYIPTEAFKKIHSETGIEISELYGVAKFYAQFRLKPVGKYIIKVCHGTACHVQNADSITESIQESLNIKDGETTADGLFTLESVACLGCCSLAPVMMLGDETYGKLTGASAVKIIKEFKIKENN